MPKKQIMELVDKSNEAILNGIRAQASLDYQHRVPEATQANTQEIINNLQNNRPNYNEFADALINHVGLTIGRNMIWSNPMSRFKIGMMQHGDSIEEYAVGLVKAHTYDSDRNAGEREIFGKELPEVKAIIHKRNRREYYKITINENELFAAFLTSGGISDFVTKLMQAPTTSDQYDEFLQMTSLFSIYEENGGFYKINTPDVRAIESDAKAAKGAIRKIIAMAKTLPFPSTKYNAARMPSVADPSDLVLFATPEYQAAVDVEALAAAFNPEKLATPQIITIPAEYWNIPGAQALLTTGDFFVVADQRIQTEQARNPVGMYTNYFLHHWSILSVSTFVPAILFTTEPGTEDVPELVTPVTAVSPIELTDRDNQTVTEVKRGGMYNVFAEAITEPAGGANNGVRFSVTGNTAPRTRITQTGVLHVHGTEGADALTVTATSTWLDSNGLTKDAKTASAELPVTGPASATWPVDEDETETPAVMRLAKEESPEDSQDVDYTGYTVEQLRGILSERNLDTDGVKSILVDRLIASDQVPAE